MEDNWYIKYTPEITEEVFNQILEYLKCIGCTKSVHVRHLQPNYPSFTNGKFIRSSFAFEKRGKTWCIDNNRQGIPYEWDFKQFLGRPIDNYQIF